MINWKYLQHALQHDNLGYFTRNKLTRVLTTMDHSYLYTTFNTHFAMTSIFPILDKIELSNAFGVISRNRSGIERIQSPCERTWLWTMVTFLCARRGAIWEVEIKLHSFLTSVLDWVSG
jgi:hypothetical protein